MKTYSAKAESIENSLFLVDAAEKTLGRLATEIARRLRGKHKPIYTPHADTGDFIVVVNAEKVRVTGNKSQDKIYHRNTTGKPGELKSVTFEKLMAEHPTRAIEEAVKGMLPKGPLGRKMFTKLKIYAGSQHPHQAQNPQPLDI